MSIILGFSKSDERLRWLICPQAGNANKLSVGTSVKIAVGLFGKTKDGKLYVAQANTNKNKINMLLCY